MPVQGNEGPAKQNHRQGHAHANDGKQGLNGAAVSVHLFHILLPHRLAHHHAGTAGKGESEHGAQVHHGIGDVHAAHHGGPQMADDAHFHQPHQRPLGIGKAHRAPKAQVILPGPFFVMQKIFGLDGQRFLPVETIHPHHNKLNHPGQHRSNGCTLYPHAAGTHEQDVQANVEHRGDDEKVQGCAAVAQRPQHAGSHVVQDQRTGAHEDDKNVNEALAAHNDNELLDYNPEENEEKEFSLYFCTNAINENDLNTLFKKDDFGRWIRKSEEELNLERQEYEYQQVAQFGFTGNEGLFSDEFDYKGNTYIPFRAFREASPLEKYNNENE